MRSAALRWITAWIGNDVRLITIEEVAYFHADNKYTQVVTGDAETLIQMSHFAASRTDDGSGVPQIEATAFIDLNDRNGPLHPTASGRLLPMVILVS